MSYIHRFDSLADLVQWVEDHPNLHSREGREQWAGTKDVGDAITLARDGWHDVRKIVDTIRHDVLSRVRDIMQLEIVPDMGVAGGPVDVGTWLNGDPMCHFTFPLEQVNAPRKVLRVLMDPGASARYGATWMANRAGAIAALLEVLQLAGHSLEVMIASPVTDVIPGAVHTPLITAHKAGTMCDIDALMYACGHPSMLRRLIFATRAKFNRRDMGHTASFPRDLLDEVDADVVLNRDEHREYGEPDAGRDPLEWVVWNLKRLNLIGE